MLLLNYFRVSLKFYFSHYFSFVCSSHICCCCCFFYCEGSVSVLLVFHNYCHLVLLVLILTVPLSCNDPGQVVHTHMCLCHKAV